MWASTTARAAWLALVFVVALAPPAHAQDIAVALPGDPAPGTGGETYASFSFSTTTPPAINASGDVAFKANLTGSRRGIFRDSGGTDTAVALDGDTAPGAGVGIYSNFELAPSINADGDVAFQANIIGSPIAAEGIFVDSGGTDTEVALRGDLAPGTGGGTYFNLGNPSINASGEVAFASQISGGAGGGGVFVASGGADTAVALSGDPAPGTGGGTYSGVGFPFINAAGDVAFSASVSGGTTGAGIFVDSGGTDRAVALRGDPAPGTIGTYGTFGIRAIAASGDVVFFATVNGGPIQHGLFLDSGGTHTAVALRGDPAPGTGGGTYSSLGFPSVTATGDVSFQALVSGGTAGGGVFLDLGGPHTVVALAGDAAPGTGGGTYSAGFSSASNMNASGDVAFFTGVTGGSVTQGIFIARRPNACEDLVDNDGDGLTDFPDDPGCDDAADNSERSASLVCDDGVDNDGDGLTDFPADLGCDDPTDDNEDSCVPLAAIKGARDLTLRNTSTGGKGSTAVKSITVSASLASTGAGGDCPDGSTRVVSISLVATDDADDEFFADTVSTDRKGNFLTATAGGKAAQAKFKVPITPSECGTTPDPTKPEIMLGEIDYTATVATAADSGDLTETVGITCKP